MSNTHADLVENYLNGQELIVSDGSDMDGCPVALAPRTPLDPFPWEAMPVPGWIGRAGRFPDHEIGISLRRYQGALS